MKKAFFQSVLLHILIAGLIIGVSRISFTDDKKDSLQLTMAVTMNNAGSGVSAKGVETSSIENSPNVAGNHVKNIKHQEGIAEKKSREKERRKEKRR